MKIERKGPILEAARQLVVELIQHFGLEEMA